MIFNIINIAKSKLVSISAVNTQTVYSYGADIDTSAITVTATYKNGSTKTVQNFSISPMTATSSTITVTYTEGGILASTSFNISILKLLESIIAVPNATEYEYAEAVGATTTAFYSDGSQSTVTGTLSPTSAVANNISVSYTDGGVTKTYSMPINVCPTASQFSGGAATVESDGTGEWTMYCNTSGTLNLVLPYDVDVWCVGGGGGGANSGQFVSNSNSAGGGGGGGYTALGSNITMSANTAYEVVVGAGGSRGTAPGSWVNVRSAGNGGVSSALNISANGGQGGAATNASNSSLRPRGGNGGSGGGGTGPGQQQTYGGNGGSNGSNGTGTKPGIGSGEHLRDFGSFSGILRAGGGGGGNYKYYNWNGSNDIYLGQGGEGGGGNGNYGQWTSDGSLRSGYNGQANYGGGGGGGGYNQGTGASQHCNGGYGGSGIVIIRKHKDESVNKFKYAYSGISTYLQEDADNWNLTISGGGTLTVTEDTVVDIYLLGGGQGGYQGYTTTYGSYTGTFGIGAAGGQGGYVNLLTNVTLTAGTYAATIGSGGASGDGNVGGTTILGSYQAPGGGSGATASGTITAGAAGGVAGSLSGSSTPNGGGAGANATIYDFSGVNRGGGGGGGYSYRYNSKTGDYSYGYAANSGGLQGGGRSFTYSNSGTPSGTTNALANYGGGGAGGIGDGGAGSSGCIQIRNHRS